MGVIIEEIFDDEESQEVNNGAEGMSQPTTQKDPSVRETENGVNGNNTNNAKEEVSGHGASEEGEGSRAEDHSLREDDNDEDWVTVSREDANIDGSGNNVDKMITKEEVNEEEDDDDMLSEEEKRAKIEQAEELKAKGNAHFSAQEYQEAIVRLIG